MKTNLNRLLLTGQLIATLNVVSTSAAKAAESSFKFGGVPFSPGSTVRANVPLSAQEKSYAGQGGNPVPQSAVAVLATPANFDPRKSWPVLVPCSTSDFKRQNRDDLVQFYQRVGLAEGWVLLAGDGPQHARNDTAAWRAAMTMAAIDALRRSFPGSDKWPIACAGFSGGAKGAGSIVPLLARGGCRIIGIYLTGVNQDYLTEGYSRSKPGANFLSTLLRCVGSARCRSRSSHRSRPSSFVAPDGCRNLSSDLTRFAGNGQTRSKIRSASGLAVR